MLTVLCALAFVQVNNSNSLALPSGRPSGATAVVVTEFKSQLDRSSTTTNEPLIETNYQWWLRNDCDWIGIVNLPIRIPSRARVIDPPEVARRHFIDQEGGCHPWHIVFDVRYGWLCQMWSDEVIGYTLIQQPPGHPCEYFAIISGTPHLIVQANTLEELELKVVERFRTYVLDTLDFQRYPASQSRTVRGQIHNHDKRLDGLVEGVSFVF
jgi:hypothetical protein